MASRFLLPLTSTTSDFLHLVSQFFSASDRVIRSLTKLLEVVKLLQSVVSQVEKHEKPDEAVEEELKDLAYSADDTVAELHYHVVQSFIENRQSATSNNKPTIKRVSDWLRAAAIKKKLNQEDGKVEVYYLSSALSSKIINEIDVIRKKFSKMLEVQQALKSQKANELRRRMIPTRSPTSPVIACKVHGREYDKEKVINLLFAEQTSTISSVSIIGQGGLGKTILAQLIYNDNRISEYFDHKIWMHVSDSVGIEENLRRMVKNILSKSSTSFSPEVLNPDLEDLIMGKKVFLVLDDMWYSDYKDWKSLMYTLKFALRTRIVVTTRDIACNRMLLVQNSHFLDFLTEGESWKLFKEHAFRRLDANDYPKLVELGKKIHRKAGGLPLAVKSLAEMLNCNLEEEHWNNVLQTDLWKLQAGDNVFPSLRLSYDLMPSHLKACFLYCSLFPKGNEFTKTELIRLWRAQGYLEESLYLGHSSIHYFESKSGSTAEEIGFEYFHELQQRFFFVPSQIENGAEIFFQMPHIFHDLAKYIAGYECWNANNNIIPDEVRHIYAGLDFMESLSHHKIDCLRTLILHGSTRQKKTGLELFPQLSKLGATDARSDYTIVLPNSVGKFKLIHLRYLRISSVKNLPRSICYLYNLRALELSSPYLEQFPSELGNLVNLIHFRFFGLSIEGLPDSISELINLQTLDMTGCKSLNYLPPSIGNLRNLRQLKLSGTAISELPESVLQLFELRILDLDGCRNLLRLCDVRSTSMSSNSVSYLPNLTVLKMNGCRKLSELYLVNASTQKLRELEVCDTDITVLPDSICQLSRLRTLKLDGCRSLSNLPTNIGEITSLHCLTISGLEICGLPRSLCELSNLQSLIMTGCCNLSRLPYNIGSLVNLIELKLSEAEFGNLPESLCELSKLQTLDLEGCDLAELPSRFGKLINLEFLNISNTNLVKLPESFCQLVELRTLLLNGCICLAQLPPDIGSLKNLHDLRLSDTNIKGLPKSFCELFEMKVLHLDDCINIHQLPSRIGRLTNIRDLKLMDKQIRDLPESFSELSKLQTLNMSGCRKFSKFDSLDSGHVKTFFATLAHIPNLEILEIDGCMGFELPTEMDGLTELRQLKLTDMEFEVLPDSICLLSNLQVLEVTGCNNLAQLPECIGNLVNLYSLRLSETNIEQLPESICLLTNLQNLNLKGNPNLKRLPSGIGKLSNLRSLELGGIGLESLPEPIYQLTNLEILNFQLKNKEPPMRSISHEASSSEKSIPVDKDHRKSTSLAGELLLGVNVGEEGQAEASEILGQRATERAEEAMLLEPNAREAKPLMKEAVKRFAKVLIEEKRAVEEAPHREEEAENAELARESTRREVQLAQEKVEEAAEISKDGREATLVRYRAGQAAAQKMQAEPIAEVLETPADMIMTKLGLTPIKRMKETIRRTIDVPQLRKIRHMNEEIRHMAESVRGVIMAAPHDNEEVRTLGVEGEKSELASREAEFATEKAFRVALRDEIDLGVNDGEDQAEASDK